ncbi:MAG: hypothetical protein M1838_002292 [Thelocarpon superellum]|nr:MAG: hypothetical protein M1838_002292 [Thelocarpon superellum]
MAQAVPNPIVEASAAMESADLPHDDHATPSAIRPSGPKRMLRSLQRISSTPSLAKIGRLSSAGYRSGGRGSISCVSLSSSSSSSSSSPSSTATPYGHAHTVSDSSHSSGAISTAPSSIVASPGGDLPFADQAKGPASIRVVEADIDDGDRRPASVPVPAMLRPGSRPSPSPLTTTTEVCEAAEGVHASSPDTAEPTPVAVFTPTWSRLRWKGRPNPDYWTEMPDEIKMQILRYLAPMEIIRCSSVSRAWHHMCFDGQLWTSLDASPFYRRIPSEALTKIISSAGPFVKDLNLRGCVQLKIDPKVEAVSNACQNLENVCLEGCQVDRASVIYLLSRNSRLVHLNLSGLAAVSNATCKVIGEHCPALEYLNVNLCYNMDARGMRKVLDGCLRLRDLRMNECRGFIDQQNMVRLFEINSLERLVIHGCSDIRDEHFKILFEGINPDICPLTRRANVPPRKLRHLDISKLYHLTDRALKSMAGNVPELEGLQLGGNVELTDAGLGELLPTIPRLTHLDLEDLSHITNETLKNIAHAPCRDRLAHLGLSYCEGIGDTGMMTLLKSCRGLKNLDIDNTRISDLSLAEAANAVRQRSARSAARCQPEVGLRIVIYDCQNVTWTGIREVISCNAEVRRPSPGCTSPSYPTEIIQLKCFYGWQMTVDEHTKRVLKGDLAAASRLERKWAEYMMATEEAGVVGAGSRRRRRRAREAAMLHADEEEGGAGTGGFGRRRRARSGGCAIM